MGYIMARSEAQKAADKRYKKTHKGQSITWATKLTPAEVVDIDAIIKANGLNKAEFLRRAADLLRK